MNLNNRSFKIFVDFDGTISEKDIGKEMFTHFGDPVKEAEIVRGWMNYTITATDSWKATCNTVVNFNHDIFDTFLTGIKIDPGFKNFVAHCTQNNYELRVLSDGFDYYINKFLKREGLDWLDIYTNKLSFGPKNELKPSFPFTDEECTKCAFCKRNHILSFSGEDDYTVYVGDGFTDFCPSQYCDFIFAKKSLLRYCETNRITYFPYSTFDDVLKKLDELKGQKRLKKRYQAELKRREVFIQG